MRMVPTCPVDQRCQSMWDCLATPQCVIHTTDLQQVQACANSLMFVDTTCFEYTHNILQLQTLIQNINPYVSMFLTRANLAEHLVHNLKVDFHI